MTGDLAPGRRIPDRCDADLRLLVEALDGFDYRGDGLSAIVSTVKALRANPKFAKRLLDLS